LGIEGVQINSFGHSHRTQYLDFTDTLTWIIENLEEYGKENDPIELVLQRVPEKSSKVLEKLIYLHNKLYFEPTTGTIDPKVKTA